MLSRWLKNARVTEIHLCLPFVQITLQPTEEPPVLPTANSQTTTADQVEGKPAAVEKSLPGAQPHVGLHLSPRPHTATALANDGVLQIDLLYRIATAVDFFGPVFTTDWQTLENSLDLRPGDYLWLRLRCRNGGDRVVHNLQIAMNGIDFVRGQRGILIRGVNGWPREEVRCSASGAKIAHLNPGDDYSLHCVVRVPETLRPGKTPKFHSIEPEFNILKQLR